MKFLTYNLADIEEIKTLFSKTFSDSEGKTEGALIGDLAYDLLTGTDNDDLYSFVATQNENIIGCIIFSRLTFDHKANAFLLGPVAIHTNHQGKGFGQRLIKFGLNSLKQDEVELAVTYGDPRFYSKVGFMPISEDVIKAPLALSQPEGWLAQSLVGNDIKPVSGHSYCVAAFNKPEFW